MEWMQSINTILKLAFAFLKYANQHPVFQILMHGFKQPSKLYSYMNINGNCKTFQLMMHKNVLLKQNMTMKKNTTIVFRQNLFI